MMCSMTAIVDVFIVLYVFHSEGLPRQFSLQHLDIFWWESLLHAKLECWSIGFQEDEAMEEKKDKIWALKSMLQPQSEQK